MLLLPAGRQACAAAQHASVVRAAPWHSRRWGTRLCRPVSLRPPSAACQHTHARALPAPSKGDIALGPQVRQARVPGEVGCQVERAARGVHVRRQAAARVGGRAVPGLGQWTVAGGGGAGHAKQKAHSNTHPTNQHHQPDNTGRFSSLFRVQHELVQHSHTTHAPTHTTIHPCTTPTCSAWPQSRRSAAPAQT